jgi:3-oxoacyl-[acyl-carrier-protein] synthase II
VRFAGEVKNFNPQEFMDYREARRSDRYTQLAIAATSEAIQQAGLDMEAEDPRRVGVIVGSGIGGIHTLLEGYSTLQTRGPRRVSPFMVPAMLVNSASGHVAIFIGARGPNLCPVLACATGTAAIGEGFALIRRGVTDVVIAGGTEAGVCDFSVAGFDVMGALSKQNDDPEAACRPFDARRDGFVIAEGSGIVVLESLEHARQRNAQIIGEVLGYGLTADAYHSAAPRQDGLGAFEAMEQAVREAAIEPSDIDYVNAHATSTLLGDIGETRALKNLLGDAAYTTPVSSTKSMMGHLLGAAGAVEAIICLKAIHEHVIPPTINYEHPDPECDLDYVPNVARRAVVDIALSNSFGFGGHNASLILSRYVNGA